MNTPMKRLLLSCLLSSAIALPALAALKEGAVAPDFNAPATLSGKPFVFSLKEALKKGPVVVYFYPSAYTLQRAGTYVRREPRQVRRCRRHHHRCVARQHRAAQ
jgi:peroxiredoxin